MRRLAATLTLILALAARAPAQDTKPPSWERLKSLVGEWEGRYSDGTPARVSYRLVSNGTAILESLSASDSDDMVTVYHADGGSLFMTHYCSVGVQSRMREKATEGGGLAFAYLDATNLTGPEDHHMTGLVMTFPDRDRLVHEWTSRTGTRQDTGRFEFVRRK
jgi:hypothetical protein